MIVRIRLRNIKCWKNILNEAELKYWKVNKYFNSRGVLHSCLVFFSYTTAELNKPRVDSLTAFGSVYPRGLCSLRSQIKRTLNLYDFLFRSILIGNFIIVHITRKTDLVFFQFNHVSSKIYTKVNSFRKKITEKLPKKWKCAKNRIKNRREEIYYIRIKDGN